MLSTRIRSLVLFVALLMVCLLTGVNGAKADRKHGTKPIHPMATNGLTVNALSGGLTPAALASSLLGEGVTISNISYTGSNLAGGAFKGGKDSIGFDEGIVLSSGQVADVVGPNVLDYTTTDHGLAGDVNLNQLSGYTTYDAAVLEFDFVPNGDHIAFRFVFASEEYNEYVNTEFNDVFAFFINDINCALVSGNPVSVNTVNNGNPYGSSPKSNPAFHINNDLDDGGYLDFEMDGLTKILTCSAAVLPGQKNQMKLAIADASDHFYDAAVFIEAGSLTTERRPVVILPGMFGSWNAECLFVELDCNDDSKWGWVHSGKEHYAQLIERLNGARYNESNGYATTFFYDWSEPLETNVSRLIKHINTVKNKTNSEDVDLVGHSMGGLLGRAYIQGNAYGHDVAHLVTLGSPHEGAAKAYPYWEGGKIYKGPQAEGLYGVGLDLVLAYFRYTPPYLLMPVEPATMAIFRAKVSGTQDILPTTDFLYEENGIPKPESQMGQRNHYLAGLNDSLDVLFKRTEVATIVSKDVEGTPDRFYVRDRYSWEWPLWEDGVPIWSRNSEFLSNHGDGTVPLSSAVLDDARAKVFSVKGVEHGWMANDGEVVDYVMNYLEISIAPPHIDPIIDSVLAVLISGPAQLTVNDPTGKTATTGGAPSDHTHKSDSIPGVEVVAFPGEPVKMIIIPAPKVGEYEILVDGEDQGDYVIAQFDNNESLTATVTNVDNLWDPFQTATEAGTTTEYTLQFTEDSEDETTVQAVTPVISTPLYGVANSVSGMATPGVKVEIHDADTQVILGTGVTSAEGVFDISLTEMLSFGRRIYATASNKTSVTVTVKADEKVYLPIVFNPSHSDQLVFVSDKHQNEDIYLIDTNGANEIRLTDNPTRDWTPSWSSDGQKIAFSSDRDGDAEIFVMDHDGSDVKQITHNTRFDCCASWSPDNSRLVFNANGVEGPQDIYIMNADGSNIVNLTSHPGEDWGPTWSPDGKKIAFNSGRTGNREIYVMNVDGSGLQNITNHQEQDASPDWSPDGKYISFISDRDGNYDIYIMKTDGSSPINLTNHPADNYGGSWSSDGTQITFTTYRHGKPEIYIMNADGSGQKRVTNNQFNNKEAEWRP